MPKFENNKNPRRGTERGHLQRGKIPPRGGMNGEHRDRRSGKPAGRNGRNHG